MFFKSQELPDSEKVACDSSWRNYIDRKDERIEQSIYVPGIAVVERWRMYNDDIASTPQCGTHRDH